MNSSDRTLWMGDLESYMDADFIGNAFSKMGETVVGVKIVFDKYTGKPGGYCFVELSDSEAARRAMLNISGKVIPKSRPPVTFNLSFANSPTAAYTEYNLFVNDIPMDLDDSGLFLVFGEKYRSCRGAKVYRNHDGSSRGLGFVRFADQTDQQRALVEMNKMTVRGKQIKLKLAQPKFRAPRGGAAGASGNPTYDPISYYPSNSDYYNTGRVLPQPHHHQPAIVPQQAGYAPQITAAQMTQPQDPSMEVEDYAPISAIKLNEQYMEECMSSWSDLIDSGYTPVTLHSSLALTHLEAVPDDC